MKAPFEMVEEIRKSPEIPMTEICDYLNLLQERMNDIRDLVATAIVSEHWSKDETWEYLMNRLHKIEELTA